GQDKDVLGVDQGAHGIVRGGRAERLDEATAVIVAGGEGTAQARQRQNGAIGRAEAVRGVDAFGHADEFLSTVGSLLLKLCIPTASHLGNVLAYLTGRDAEAPANSRSTRAEPMPEAISSSTARRRDSFSILSILRGLVGQLDLRASKHCGSVMQR